MTSHWNTISLTIKKSIFLFRHSESAKYKYFSGMDLALWFVQFHVFLLLYYIWSVFMHIYCAPSPVLICFGINAPRYFKFEFLHYFYVKFSLLFSAFMQVVWQEDIDTDNMTYEVCYVYTLSSIVAMACFFQMKYILLEVELLYLCFLVYIRNVSINTNLGSCTFMPTLNFVRLLLSSY